MSVHTIWVPEGWSVEQVWETIKRGDTITIEEDNKEFDGVWVTVDDKGKVIA